MQYYVGLVSSHHSFSHGLRKRINVDFAPIDIHIGLEDKDADITYAELPSFINGLLKRKQYEYASVYMLVIQFSAELRVIRLYGFPVETLSIS